MILYAKSSLELIVNNRIGKVGIRPDAAATPSSHPRKPRSARCAAPPPQPSAAHLIWHWSQRVADLLLSVRPSVRPTVRLSVSASVPYRPTLSVGMYLHVRGPRTISVRGYERIYIYTYIYVYIYVYVYIYIYIRWRRPAYVYLHRYVRIITYKRVILSYTPALLMIIKTPRSILFALEYFLKFSPDNGAIRRASRPVLLLATTPFALAFFAFSHG